MAFYQNPLGIGEAIGQYYTGALAQDPRMAAIQRNISGRVAPDVRNQLAQSAAERGIGIGSYGAGADQSAFLKALGLTSLDLTNRGIGQYGEAYSAVPKLTPGELFVTPTAEAGMALERELTGQKLASEAALQAGRLGTQERMQQAALAQEMSQFGINRSDTQSGRAATSARLDDILGRLGGGGYGGPAAGTGAISTKETTSSYNPFTDPGGVPYYSSSQLAEEGIIDPLFMYGTTSGLDDSSNYQPEYSWDYIPELDY